MQRSMRVSRWFGSMALVALLAGATARAADPAPAPMPAGQATVTVKVVDADGKGVAGVKVTIAPPKAKKAKKGGDAAAPTSQPAAAMAVSLTGTTDADGTAVVKDVPDGSYQVRAAIKGGAKGMAKLKVAEGKDESVSVTLAAPAAN